MHRCCPQCAWLPRERWLRGWKERLLPVPHHHIVFTVSHLLNEIWRFNKKQFSKVLFRSVSETLLELLADPKYLGARPGLLAALHTWNQQLLPHIHMHVLVTAGGLTQDNQWAAPKKECLLPRKVLMLKFRGKFLSLLGEASKKGQLRLPTSWGEGEFERVLKQSRTKDWNRGRWYEARGGSARDRDLSIKVVGSCAATSFSNRPRIRALRGESIFAEHRSPGQLGLSNRGG